ncbi:MAG: hypothetical protein PUF83_07720, partial [Intestinibaculum porci]|uniref:hypothetical protein n=1 Tax=Intestinibaculum porci TaxID=2487118 RepID=UPI002409B274
MPPSLCHQCIMSHSSNFPKTHIKDSDVIAKFSKVDTILFDKTGTLTYGNPEVTDSHYYLPDH